MLGQTSMRRLMWPITFCKLSRIILLSSTTMMLLQGFRLRRIFSGAGLFSMHLGFGACHITRLRPKSLPGIPLRLNADFNDPSTRQSIADGYDQVLADLKKSARMLPDVVPSPTRPSKAAAYGMLSRVYLQMRDYIAAGEYADSCLRFQQRLLDYNTLTITVNFPLPHLNEEVIFESRVATAGPIVQSRALINPVLYDMYHTDYLRKLAFFRASGTSYIFKGSYQAGATLFNGITTAEMLLTRAECKARDGKVNEALDDLNLLLQYRYRTGTFVPTLATSSIEALEIIKDERRKELAFRSMRWLDIKRYNEEGDGITLSRTIDGKVYKLEPQSKGYALPIPEDVIALSGMEQNER